MTLCEFMHLLQNFRSMRFEISATSLPCHQRALGAGKRGRKHARVRLTHMLAQRARHVASTWSAAELDQFDPFDLVQAPAWAGNLRERLGIEVVDITGNAPSYRLITFKDPS